MARGFFRRQRKHRLQKAMVADFELRCVDTDRHPDCARIEIITRQRALMALVQLARGVERQRMRGDDAALAERCERGGGDVVDLHGFALDVEGVPSTGRR